MKSKKRGVEAIGVIIALVLGLVVLFVVTGGFIKLFGKGVGQTQKQIEATDDYDGDMVPNFNDKCPCEAGDIKNNGCQIGETNIPNAKCREKQLNSKCTDTKC